MPVTKSSNLFVPEIFEQHIRGGVAGVKVMRDTGAAIFKTGMRAGSEQIGQEIKIPYFNHIGELDDVAQGDALTPTLLSDSTELATVNHSGKAFEVTRWGASQPSDPYAEGARQMTEAVARRADKALIDVAMSPTSWSSYTKDVHSASTPVTMSYDLIVDSKFLFGDEQDDIAAMVVHSLTARDMYKVKDATGRPLLVEGPAGSLPRLQPLGIPVFITDRATVNGSAYYSAILKRNSLIFWINENPSIKEDSDILADTEVAAVHIYWAAHRYKRLDGRSKPGVVLIKHNVQS